MMSGVLGDALYAYVFLIGFAEKAEGLIVVWTELVILADLLFLACELEGDIVFS